MTIGLGFMSKSYALLGFEYDSGQTLQNNHAVFFHKISFGIFIAHIDIFFYEKRVD